MGLFGNKKSVGTEEAASEAPSPATSENFTPAQAEQIARIVAQAVANVQGQQQTAPVASAESADDEPPDPRADERMRRIMQEEMRTTMMPYAEAFNSAVPATVRAEVVATLKPGQKMIYEKYKNEVDALINQGAATPQAKANPTVHRRAISMVLGDHSDEIEALSLQHATAEDVPHLGIPTSSAAAAAAAQTPKLSETEKTLAEGFRWTPEQFEYYKNIPKGYLFEMVASHRQQKAARAEAK